MHKKVELKVKIRLATLEEHIVLTMFDHHIDEEELVIAIELGRVSIVQDEEDEFVGWLRYNLFWDQIPFVNMLYIREEYRNQGYGKKLMECFEEDMKELGYDKLMVSTQDNETAKYFYIKIGYKIIGGFTIPNEEYELILHKNI